MKMAAVPETIEAEIIEIDGAPPPEQPPQSRAEGAGPDWSSWKTRVLTLDRRWWPLWVMLGILLLGAFLVLGVVAGVVLIVFRLMRGIVRFLTGGSSASRRGAIRRFQS